MGREERRRKAKQDKKINDKKVEAMRWVQSLPPAKAELIHSYSKMIADRDNKHFIDALDRCYTAAMAINFEHLEWDELQGVMETFSHLIEQDARKMRKLQDESGGSIDMATKKVNEKSQEVEQRIRTLLVEGKKQKEIIEILSLEFNTLSRAMLTNALKKTKQLIKQENVGEVIAAGEKVRDLVNKLGEPDVDTKEALEYIFEDKKEEGYAPVEEITVEELDKAIAVEEDEFEIISRTVELKGKFAKYLVQNKVVEVNNGEFGFVNEVEVMTWANDEVKELENKIEAIKGQANETIKVMKKYL